MQTFATQHGQPQSRETSLARSNTAALAPGHSANRTFKVNESRTVEPQPPPSRLEPHWGHDFSRLRIHGPTLQRACDCGGQHRKLDPDEERLQPSSASAPVLQRKCAKCEKDEEEQLLRRSPAPGAPPSAAPPIVNRVLGSAGSALEPGVRSTMETRFGRDLGHVRVHTDAGSAESAAAVHAQAYTVGSHIVFGAGRYAPSTDAGLRLMAHELVHVSQQSDVRLQGARPIPIGAPDTPQEREAEALSSQLSVQPAATASPSLQREPDRESPGAANPKSHTTWPRWHEIEFQEHIAKIGGPSDGKTADQRWPAFRSYLCGLSKDRAQSLYERWAPNAPGLQPSAGHPQGSDDLAVYVKSKFPVHYSDVITVLSARAADTRPPECDTKPEKQTAAKPAQNALTGAREKAAAVAYKIPSTEQYRQLTCVSQNGGCAQSLPGGVPDAAKYKSANDSCRKTSGYQGEDVTPTEEECDAFKDHSPISVARVEQLKQLLIQYDQLVKAGAFSQAEMGPIEQQIQETCRTLSQFSPIDCSPQPATPATPAKAPAPEPEPIASRSGGKPAQASTLVPAIAGGLRAAGPVAVSRASIVANFLLLAGAATYVAVSHEQRVGAAGLLELLIMLLLRATGKFAELAKTLGDGTIEDTTDDPKPKKDPRTDDRPPRPFPILPCPRGTEDDPIPMIWFKPSSEYKSIKLFGETYYRNKRKKLPGKGEEIGVSEWPSESGKPFQRVATPDTGEKERFRKVLEGEGFDWSGLDADHVLDLNFSGDDAFSNLWPLDSDVNRYAGTWHPGQPVCYSTPGRPRRIEAIGSSTLAGRWFVASSTWKLKNAK